MSLTTNKIDGNGEDLLNQLTATLKSVQNCLGVFGDNPRYSRICEKQAQKNNGLTQTPTTILNQFEALRDTSNRFLTPSYAPQSSIKNRQKP